MTITYLSVPRAFVISHGHYNQTISVITMRALAQSNEWGDVETIIADAQKFPGRAITVDNRPRIKHALGHRRIGGSL